MTALRRVRRARTAARPAEQRAPDRRVPRGPHARLPLPADRRRGRAAQPPARPPPAGDAAGRRSSSPVPGPSTSRWLPTRRGTVRRPAAADGASRCRARAAARRRWETRLERWLRVPLALAALVGRATCVELAERGRTSTSTSSTPRSRRTARRHGGRGRAAAAASRWSSTSRTRGRSTRCSSTRPALHRRARAPPHGSRPARRRRRRDEHARGAAARARGVPGPARRTACVAVRNAFDPRDFDGVPCPQRTDGALPDRPHRLDAHRARAAPARRVALPAPARRRRRRRRLPHPLARLPARGRRARARAATRSSRAGSRCMLAGVFTAAGPRRRRALSVRARCTTSSRTRDDRR